MAPTSLPPAGHAESSSTIDYSQFINSTPSRLPAKPLSSLAERSDSPDEFEKIDLVPYTSGQVQYNQAVTKMLKVLGHNGHEGGSDLSAAIEQIRKCGEAPTLEGIQDLMTCIGQYHSQSICEKLFGLVQEALASFKLKAGGVDAANPELKNYVASFKTVQRDALLSLKNQIEDYNAEYYKRYFNDPTVNFDSIKTSITGATQAILNFAGNRRWSRTQVFNAGSSAASVERMQARQNKTDNPKK